MAPGDVTRAKREILLSPLKKHPKLEHLDLSKFVRDHMGLDPKQTKALIVNFKLHISTDLMDDKDVFVGMKGEEKVRLLILTSSKTPEGFVQKYSKFLKLDDDNRIIGYVAYLEENDKEKKEKLRETKAKNGEVVEQFLFKDCRVPKEEEKKTEEQKQAFEEFINRVLTRSPEDYCKEYDEQLKQYTGNKEHVISDLNLQKNRYPDIPCNDWSRVVINDDIGCDYVHANYVNGLHIPIVAAQGPTENTVTEFWRMLISTKTTVVVMLCDWIEETKEKCAWYLPKTQGDTLVVGPYLIICTKIDTKDPTMIKRNLSIKGPKGMTQTVKHMQSLSWKDHSAPTNVSALFRMLYVLRSSSGTTCVHCSAGIGRTGTLVAIEIGLETMSSGLNLDLLSICQKLRQCRRGAIQTETQYLTIVLAVLQYSLTNGFWSDAAFDRKVQLKIAELKVHIDTLEKGRRVQVALPQPIPQHPPQKKKAPLAVVAKKKTSKK